MIDQQILEIIAKTSDCREEHIYDGVFVDEHETQVSIAALLAVGDIVAVGVADDTFYHLSDKFKASERGKRIMKLVEVERDVTPGLSRVERAIAFVRTKETATSAELHMVMELGPDELASHYLADALADGRLIKDGKFWTLGAGAAVEAKPEPLKVPTFVPPQQESNVVHLSPRTARVKPAKLDFAGFADFMDSRSAGVSEVASTTSCTVPAIRCGLWSDGAIEVQRDGKTTAVLFAEEMVCLADFWGRIATNAKEAM